MFDVKCLGRLAPLTLDGALRDVYHSAMRDPDTSVQIKSLFTAVGACRVCRDSATKPLPHEPRPVVVLSDTAKILIAGQAPGLRVHESGIPFNDASGDRLRQWLAVSRDQFYDSGNFAIVPMGFCFPGYDAKGADLPPRRECAPIWRQRTIDAMPQIELVIAVGGYAQHWHIAGAAASMTETVYEWRRHVAMGVIPLPHPSWRNTGWLRRNPWFEAELLPELRRKVSRWIS